MTSVDRSCIELKHLYLEALQRILATGKPRGNRRGIRRIIDYTETHPVEVHRPGGHRTWVWSDLHLRHGNIIKYCDRPFRDAPHMDGAIMTGWRSAVGDGDTLLNGGDVALAGALDEAGRAELREAPGRKLLVVGNHDFNRRTGLLDAAEHETATGILAIDTDPPMALTHLPMDGLPPGWVNLYGPLAQQRAPARHPAHQRVRRAHRLPAPAAQEPARARQASAGRRRARRGDDGRPGPGGGGV